MAGQRLTQKSSLDNHTGTGDLYMIVDVSDTTGSSAGTSKKLDSKFVIQTDKISVSSAEFQAMDATGGAGTFKTLISAPGSGYMIVPITVTILVNYVSSADTTATTLLIGWDTSQVNDYWARFVRFMRNATNDLNFHFSSAVDAVATNLDNAPFYLWADQNFNGDFTADVYVTYHIVKLS